MRFVYYPLSLTMDIKKGEIFSLIIESPALFEKLIVDIDKQISRQQTTFALYEEEKELDLSKSCELIVSPFDLFYNKREIQKKLYHQLESIIVENDIVTGLCEAHGRTMELLESLNFELDYDIEYNEDFNTGDILKFYDVHIRKSEGTFAEKLLDYMKIIKKMLGKELFIIANCDAFLSENDYTHIEKSASYYDLSVVFFRNRQNRLNGVKNEYIIDMDLCEIH